MSEVKIIKLKYFIKKSGTLVPINFNNKFPIKVKRIFYIFGKKNKSNVVLKMFAYLINLKLKYFQTLK